MPKLVINGREIEAKAGQSVLQAAKDHGIHIPHFCFHSRLKVAGNCRICLVEIEKMPKLQIACGTEVRDGMVVITDSPRVAKARRAVLEFLLINHPLDCPTCDQSGECKLQDYCFEYGQAKSRFREEKHTFPIRDVGPLIARNQNRCIHCTRCVRFLRDVAGSEELTLSERGGHAAIESYLEAAIGSPFSLNLAEICPVGALTSKPFRFQGRVWLLDQVRTICPGCARGCNALAWSTKGRLLRLTPAYNDAVNRAWLCDEGRLGIDRINAEDRILRPSVAGAPCDLDKALDAAAERLRALTAAGLGSKIAVVGSGALTNEDSLLVVELAALLGAGRTAFVRGPETPRPFAPSDAPLTEWFIRDDKAPNSRGAGEIFSRQGGAADLAAILDAIGKGEVSALIAFGADPAAALPGAEDRLRGLGFLMACDARSTRTAALAHVVIPEAFPFEKDGSCVNEGGRLQRLVAAVPPRGDARPAWRTAADLAKRLGATWAYASAEQIRERLAPEKGGPDA